MTAITRLTVPASTQVPRDPAELQAALDEALRIQAALRRKVERQERQLQAKSHLLDEVNHRAKNNLQMAIGLLSMQALASDDARVSAALEAAAQRLGYLARVHELLYRRRGDSQEIELSGFLRDIGGALADAYRREEVRISYDIPPLTLDVERAISVGLMVGETVLNAYKYAFPNGAAGTIAIACTREDASIRLVVSDDGAGFPAEERRGSLGMRLLRALGRSLGGETVVESGSGTSVGVVFPASPAQDH